MMLFLAQIHKILEKFGAQRPRFFQIFPNLTMEIFKLWPWSWSIFFDHFDHEPLTQAKWSKNRGRLTPP